jgi:phytoene dehydrogenase-like protein
MSRYDAVVIGSGQAGNPLSQKLADHGWTVALIKKDHLGGTCINTGRWAGSSPRTARGRGGGSGLRPAAMMRLTFKAIMPRTIPTAGR